MESRAKQRLTGAVILVALFVLLVPELLTGPRDAHAPADTSQEEGLRSYTIDLEGHDAATGQATPPANNSAVNLPAVPAPKPGATTPPATARAVPGEAAAPDPAPSSPPAANSVPPATQPARTEAPRPAPPRAPAPASVAKPAAAGSFVVQLGTFSQRENADRLTREMTAKGFAAFVVPVTSNGHELYRVRVGPTRDRAAAEALAAQLKRMGQSGSIVPIS